MTSVKISFLWPFFALYSFVNKRFGLDSFQIYFKNLKFDNSILIITDAFLTAFYPQ